ncbi:phosphoheptose isomerase [Terriglobus roseus DSM 18391]|uniref:Phosphoheptose isomerase n=1 Tax=Terriglobus roseus (strain DSM 18391 / NRRL B-41598 / KBS 63) TaxID=926566 RepID=I3ZEM1_TERRK|nr:SIS domain-containing protein [Terriglobus roseus]AFL87689.1 phosphoheptose isomerase [Terriglobus roseus DSM 18391]
MADASIDQDVSIFQHNVSESLLILQSLRKLEPQVERAAKLLADALLSGKKLLACGNGGSAADASHLTTEFVVRYQADRRPYPAISFTTNGGDLTACGNDYGFDEIFARQVRAFGHKGDVLFAFTTSGNSENVLRALLTAKDTGVSTVAFLGRDGGSSSGIADVEFLVEHGVTARIQEAHKLLLHTICELVEVRLHAAANAGHQPLT